MVHPEGCEPREREVVEQSRREWVEQWRCSGLTQTEFCRRNGLAMSSLSRWKMALVAQDSGESEVLRSPQDQAPPRWLAVRVRAEVPAPAVLEETPGAEFEVVVRGGRRVRLGRQFDAEGLRRLVAVLESLPC